MTFVYDPKAPKKATNLSINSDLLLKAKALNINLSAFLERTLATHVRSLTDDAWRRESAAAISLYNQDVEQNGLFGEDSREF